MISATVEPPLLDSRLVRTFVEDVLGRAGRDRAEVVEQRLRRRRADHAQHRDQREQHREQREDAEVGQRGGPGRQLVLAELLERPLQDRREGLLGRSVGWSGDVAAEPSGALGWMRLGPCARATQNRGFNYAGARTARQFPDADYKAEPCTAPCRSPSATSMLAPARRLSSAHAASFQCDASALRATVATAPAEEPITANRGAAACAAQEAGGALPASAARRDRRRALRPHDLHRGRSALAGRRLRAPALGELVRRAAAARPARARPLRAAGRRRARRPGDRERRHPPGAGRARRARRPAAGRQGRHRRGERELPGRHARPSAGASTARRRSPCSAPSSRPTDAVDRNLALDSQSIDPSKIDISKVARAGRRRPRDAAGDAEADPRHAAQRRGPGARAARAGHTRRAGPRGRQAHPPRAAIQIELAGTPLLDAVVGEATVDATGVELRLARRRGARARSQGLHDAPADADRRRPARQPGRAPGRRRPAPLRRQDRADRLALERKTVARLKVAKTGLFTTTVKLPPRGAAPHEPRPLRA